MQDFLTVQISPFFSQKKKNKKDTKRLLIFHFIRHLSQTHIGKTIWSLNQDLQQASRGISSRAMPMQTEKLKGKLYLFVYGIINR